MTLKNKITSYTYIDERGRPVARIDRIEPGRDGGRKEFLPYLALAEGGFSDKPGLSGSKLPLYRLDEVRAALENDGIVFLLEGEGKAELLSDRLRAARPFDVATTIAHGAGASLDRRHIEQLRGAKAVVVLADSDGVGRHAANERARRIAEAYSECDVRVVDLFPDRGDGSDLAEWFEEGHSLDEMLSRVASVPRTNGLNNDGDSPTVTWGDARPWPHLTKPAFYGLAGDFARLVGPNSEGDPAALLVQFLAFFGCAAGTSPHFMVGATSHPARINVLLVGESAIARKGTSIDEVKRVFRIADERWLEDAVLSGLASGEGLIARLSDRDEGGPAEKRALVIEPEFARVLAAASRRGSILSAIIRDAWDAGRLQNVTKVGSLIAKGCHVSLIGHITANELRSKLPTTEMANGFL